MCRTRQAAIYTWASEGDPTTLLRRTYRCCSWRCEGECARRDAAIAFARMKEAMQRPEFAADGWVYFVTTIDREGYYSGRPWADLQDAYKQLSKMSRNFLSGLRRMCERNGWTNPESNWAQTIEAHRSGWPHANLVLYCPELAELARERSAGVLRPGLLAMGVLDPEVDELLKLNRAQRRERLERNGVLGHPGSHHTWRRNRAAQLDALERTAIYAGGELLQLLLRHGWGRLSTVEGVQSGEALAGYMVKLAGEHAQTVGELAKLTQVPTSAKGKFRRLRSGIGFLPPRRKKEGVTGTMIRRELRPERAEFMASAIYEIKHEAQRAMARKCCELEQQRIERECHARHVAKTTGVPYSELAPGPIEQYRLRGENFVLLGASVAIDGEVFGVTSAGDLTWSPADNRGFT